MRMIGVEGSEGKGRWIWDLAETRVIPLAWFESAFLEEDLYF